MDNKTNKRSFILGEEWIYYKLYSGSKTADKILEEAIQPATEYLINAKLIDQWFFVRYSDPDLHLRIRLHCVKTDDLAAIIQTVYQYIEKYVAQEYIWKVQTDTYQREVERYGIHTMELSEQLFFAESRMLLNIFPLLKNPSGESQRWIIGLKLTDILLDSFKCTKENKMRLLQNLRENFAREFGVNRFLKSQLDAKFLKERKRIENSLNESTRQESFISDFMSLLKSYNETICPIVNNILMYSEDKELELPLDDLICSYIHMTMNRLFRSNQRMHEMILYDFLSRYYKSIIVRNTIDEKTKSSSVII